MQTQPSLKPLTVALIVVVLLWGGLAAFTAAAEGSATQIERQIVLALRSADDPARMIGSRWMEEIMRDFTALGGYAVLTIVVVTATVFFRLTTTDVQAKFLLATTVGGYVVGMTLKLVVGRERPAIVPHLSHVDSSSLPSVHSMMSTVVYLTIGLLLAGRQRDSRVRRLLVGLPLILTVLVGCSRVFMGVHYPSDVLAGWTAGLLWTAAAFRMDRRLTERRGTPAIPSKTGSTDG